MLAFSIDYYGMIFRATQSVELFCAYYLSGILWLSSNMCETDKKGLTELSEINLVRPFFVGFYFAFFG